MLLVIGEYKIMLSKGVNGPDIEQIEVILYLILLYSCGYLYEYMYCPNIEIFIHDKNRCRFGLDPNNYLPDINEYD